MGVNYGKRRGRLEIINPTQIIGYSIGTKSLKFDHIDTTKIADIVNERLDKVEQRIRERF